MGPAVCARAIRPPSSREIAWYWRAVVYQGGDERTVWTGRGDPEQVRAELWQVIGRGEHLAPVEVQTTELAEVSTVSDLLALWRGHLVGERGDLEPGTIAAYTSHSRVVEEVIGSVLLDQLSRQDLERYRGIVVRPPGEGSRRRRARSPGSLHLDMIVLQQAWAWGRSIGACPARDLDVPTVRPTRVRERYTPTAGEVAAVAQRLTGWRRDLVELQWATGARVGELAALRVADVDLVRGELVVGRHAGARKTGMRRVPVHPDTIPMLRRLVGGRGPDDTIWPATWQMMRHHLNGPLAEACAALRQPVWTTHALRRAYVVRAIRARIDVATLSTITGHSVEVLLAIYREVQDEDRQEAVARLPGRLPRGVVVALSGGGPDPHTAPAQPGDE
jgi:integrase